MISNDLSLIYEAYHEDVYRLLYFMSGNKEVSEDVMQNTFVKVFKNLHQLKNNDKMKAWIFQIARNQYRDHLKSAYESRKIEKDEIEIAQQSQAETVVELIQTLNLISVDHREILILIEMEGMTIQEVSEITRISEAAVKSRLHRARQELIAIKNESI